VASPWSDTFGTSGRARPATVELPDDERELVDLTLRLLDGLAAEIEVAEAGIARTVVDDARVRRLLSIPGIGLQTAVGLVAVVGDVGRFARPNKLVGYLGLDPIVRQSGGRPAYTGHISHAGQGHVRGLLVEAALGAVRVPGPLHAFHGRVAARRGHAIAIVAVARKLAVLAWHLLSHDVDYRWAPARLTATKIRAVELAAGAPSNRGRVSGSGDARERARRERELERVVLAQADAAYVAFVDARRETDAVATNGERLSSARAKPGKAARRSQIPEPPPFATGSTASGRRIRPALDTFIRQPRLRSTKRPKPRWPTKAPSRITARPRTKTERTAPVTSIPSYAV
jgi:transposase IS116/IS110/IS902 family protein